MGHCEIHPEDVRSESGERRGDAHANGEDHGGRRRLAVGKLREELGRELRSEGLREICAPYGFFGFAQVVTVGALLLRFGV